MRKLLALSALVLLMAGFALAAACGGDEAEKIVVQTVIVEKAGETVVEKVVETVIVEKQVAGETIKVVETVVVEKEVEKKVVETVIVEKSVTQKVVETVIVEKPVTRVEKVVETVIVEKEVAGETVKVVETVIVEKPVTRVEKVVETVVVEKVVEATAAPKVRQTGKLVIALNSVQSPIVDPQSLVFPTATMMVGIGIHEGLFRWGLGADGKPTNRIPTLAEGWEVAPDQSKVTLFLRRGVPFRAWDDAAGGIQDWGEMVADDVAWLYNRAGADNIESRHDQADLINEVFNPFKVVDTYTVDAPFKQYRGDFIDGTMAEAVGVQSAKANTARLAGTGPDMPDTTGPFVVRNWLPLERIELVSVPEHWRRTASIAELLILEVPEAAVRAAMLRTAEAHIAPVSVADVPTLASAGIRFTEELKAYQGLWVHFAGNYWMTEDPVSGDPLTRTIQDEPWIGNPFEADGTFNRDTPSMVSARKVRQALAMSVDRDLLSATILGGYGGPNYQIFNDSHPEWDDKFKVPFDPARAKELLNEAGYPDGFEFNLWCPLDVGNDIEICQAVSGMWQEHLNVDAQISVTVYTANRPKLVDRTATFPWVLPWGSNRLGASGAAPGGTYPGCCRWPTIGFNIGYEDPAAWAGYVETRVQERASAENMASRARLMEEFAAEWLEWGIVDFPNLIGLGEEVVAWELRPLLFINTFESIVMK